MNEFEKCAREYCDVKVQHVDLKRLILLLPCQVEGDPIPGESWDNEPPCWMEIDEGAICLDEACENCQTTRPMVERRRELGKRLPNLAKAMYRAFRAEMRP